MRSFLVAILAMSLCASACTSKEECLSKSHNIEHVARVFMHEPGVYSIMVENPATHELSMVEEFPGSALSLTKFRATVIADVLKGDGIWARNEAVYDADKRSCDHHITIHIHSITDINAAGWNHGKFGSGTTTVVE